MYNRNCPSCNKEINYKSKYSYKIAHNKNTKCNSCSVNRKLNNMATFKTKDFKQKMSSVTKGNKNGMYGRSFYSVWVEKYGKEEAYLKMVEYKKKQSLLNSGEKNNMYGKPSPNGSGNGWSGWYKNHFFKSLKELSCILYFEKNNIIWESAENKKFRIEYTDWDNKKRNYYPDFFLPKENKIIECKPIHLVKSKNILLKKISAEIFCKINGYTYEFMDPDRLSDNDILKLYNNGDLKFIDRYQKKFDEKYNK